MSDRRIIDLDFLFIPLTILAFFGGLSLLVSSEKENCECEIVMEAER